MMSAPTVFPGFILDLDHRPCRRRVLKAFNWIIVSVPYYDWYGMDNTSVKASRCPFTLTRSLLHVAMTCKGYMSCIRMCPVCLTHVHSTHVCLHCQRESANTRYTIGGESIP